MVLQNIVLLAHRNIDIDYNAINIPVTERRIGRTARAVRQVYTSGTMPFKIVQTKERNKVSLMTVPSSWEQNGILRWPKQPHKCIKDGASVPEEYWSSLPCIVKRKNIDTYEAADKEVSIMLMQSDTEEETSFVVRNKENALKSLDLNTAYELNIGGRRNNQFREYMFCNQNEESMTTEVHNIIDANTVRDVDINFSASDTTTPLITDTNTVYNLQIIDENAGNNNCNEIKILETLNQVLTNQSQILEAVQSLKKIQDNLVHRVAGFSVQLDDICLQIKQPEMNVQSLMQSSNTKQNTPMYIKPIENEIGLNDLERSLADVNTRTTLFKTYSIVCNKGKATDCAYSYAEIMFDRKFLCECSWSGGSRTENSKIAFKDFKNIIHFFWSLVFASDNNYTLKDNADFFKNLLKNSKKRLVSKNQRASTSRSRAKRTKLNVEVVSTPTTIFDEMLNNNDTTKAPTGDETLNTANRNTDIDTRNKTNLPDVEEYSENDESLC